MAEKFIVPDVMVIREGVLAKMRRSIMETGSITIGSETRGLIIEAVKEGNVTTRVRTTLYGDGAKDGAGYMETVGSVLIPLLFEEAAKKGTEMVPESLVFRPASQ